MGQQAARLLIQLIEGNAPPRKKQQLVLPPELIVRDSSGAGPGPRAALRSATRSGRYSLKG